MKLYHLFPDLMNLYGDYGNLAVLQKALRDAGRSAEIVPVRPGDSVDLGDADLLYMGPGAEPARNAALAYLRPYAQALEEALLAKNTPALFTGNAWSVLGHSITTADDDELPGLGIFDFLVEETWNRVTGDVIAHPAQTVPGLPDRPVVGFLNRCDKVVGMDAPLFYLDMGLGNDGRSPAEGFVRQNLYATHLIGPLLVKNPHLLRHFLSLLGVAPPPVDDGDQSALAYQTTLAALQARLANKR